MLLVLLSYKHLEMLLVGGFFLGWPTVFFVFFFFFVFPVSNSPVEGCITYR